MDIKTMIEQLKKSYTDEHSIMAKLIKQIEKDFLPEKENNSEL